MCSRRNKPVLQAVVFLGLVGCLGYFVYLYNTKSLKLERTDRQLKKYIQHQQSLSSQLKVVYEHRALLEKSFEKEKIDHKKTMQDLAIAKREFSRNTTRTKHETLNRFNSLETQHRMLKAQYEQIQLEYNRLQQQHARLSAEHQSVHNQQRNAFNIMKTQKQNEIMALEDQLRTLKKQVQSWKVEYGNQKQETDYYKGRISEHVKEGEKNKAVIRSLYDNINQLQRRLSSGQQQERNVGRSHDQAKPSDQFPNQQVNQRQGIGRPGRPAVRNVIPTITTLTKNTIQRSPNKDNDVKSDDDETEDKDSEEDDDRLSQQNGAQPKEAVAAPVNNGQASRKTNEPPVILQATQPSVITSKIEAEDSDEAERKKVERYLTRNEENPAKQQQRQQQQQQQQQREQEQQRLQQQQQRQQLLQQQQQQRQQQRKHEGLYQNLQQEQQQQNSREMYQRLQQLQQQQHRQQQPQRREQQHHYQPHQPQQRKSDERSENTRLDRRPNEPEQQKEHDNDDPKETNSLEQRSQTGDKQKEFVKPAEEKRSEQFRRPIGRPGGREAVERNLAKKESQDSVDKREEQPAQEENNEEEEEDDNENDERDNTINQGQENQDKSQEVNNRQNQPDNRQKDSVNPHVRGLRHA